MEKSVVNKNDVMKALQDLELPSGCTLTLHSSIKSIGYVDGGARTVADALIEAVGPEGTLAIPTFTFCRPPQAPVTVDPATDPCDVGAINKALWQTPGALRSIAATHSFALLGKHKEEMYNIPPEVCPLGDQSVFGKLMELDAYILLLGVAYTHCTAGHFAEYLCQVPHRAVYPQKVLIRAADGSLKEVIMNIYAPREDIVYPPRDFNRAGSLLEKADKVKITTLGNAYLRLFKIRDFVNLVVEHYRNGDNLLTHLPNEPDTILQHGVMVKEEYTDLSGNFHRSVRSVVKTN